MEPQEPDNPHNPSTSDEALRRLEERLSRASEAAERLIAEAAGSAQAAATGAASAWAASADVDSSHEAGGPAPRPETGEGNGGADAAGPRKTPPAGWQIPPSAEDRRSGDLELLMQFIQSVRELIPRDLQRRLGEALRELLLAIRALIDWYLERNEQRRAGGDEVQDIPIL